MNSRTILLTALCAFLAFSASAATGTKGVNLYDWPGWRGPTHNGIAAPGQKVPTEWDEKKNIVWKTAIPGRGHGSPTVVGKRIYLPTANEKKQTQSVICLDRKTGKEIWTKVVHSGDFNKERQKRASWASASIACDGQRLYINFFNRDAIYTYALGLYGDILWETKIADFVSHQGYGASPLIYKDLVIVTADTKAPGGGAIAGLDRKTGKIVWKNKRPELPNYPSPVVFNIGGKDQLIVTGCDLISSFNPMTGKTIWEHKGSTTECVVTAVTDGVRVFTGGGYPKNHTVAMRADGSGKVDWINSTRIYVPSMIAKDGHLYAVADAGFAHCWESATGKLMWKERLGDGRKGGDFFSSPTMVGDRIYATNVRGQSFVFTARPDKFKLLAQNNLGDESYSTPIVCGGRIYLRVAKKGDTRQEFLYCIGQGGH
jgi:outer membrane protein assembly factor BamB